jgi:hypothetical protein
LTRGIAFLVERGHSNVLRYPMALFVDLLSHYQGESDGQ